MKKIVLLAMGLLFLPMIAIAYQVNIDAPETLTVGKPLIVNGITTFPPGMAVDVVLYYQLTTTTEIKRQVVGVRPDKTFRVVFDTTGLKTGTYKVEVPVNGMGDSVTMRLVRIIDRSDEIQMESSVNQQFSGILVVAGTIKGDENSGVQVEVFGPDNSVVFGPQFINTDYEGGFSTEVPITIPGDYEVSFTDDQGFIGTRVISATVRQTTGAVPAGATAPQPRLSAHATASRDAPAYFAVKTGLGPVILYTSTSFDWVMEYFDENGLLHVENSQDAQNPERASVPGTGTTIYVKLYPFSYSEQGDVFLYAEHAEAVFVSPAVPAPFAAAAPASTGKNPAVPLMPFSGLAALGIALLLRR